jgi:heavy metal efflux system protein
MGRIVAAALRLRGIVFAFALALVGVGLWSYSQLDIEAYPNPVAPMIEIITQPQGWSAEEVERYVTIPLENGLTGMTDLDHTRSQSLFGLSDVKCYFNWNPSYTEAHQRVINRLQFIQLPQGVQPQLSPWNAIGEIYRYVLRGPGYSLAELKTAQDWILERQFRQVPGVIDVVGFGGETKQIHVDVDPMRLKGHGLTLQQLSTGIANANQNVGGQRLTLGEQSFNVRGIGLIKSLRDVEQVVVNEQKGIPVRVRDVADVKEGAAPRLGIVGKDLDADIVQGIVLMRYGGDSLKTLDGVHSKVEQIRKFHLLPPGMTIEAYYDRERLVHLTTHTVLENLLVGMLLVTLVLWVFLGQARAAVLAAVNIPLALLAAFCGMVATGTPANLISLGAVDFGIIIDGAVVVVEALMVRLSIRQFNASMAESDTGWRMNVLKDTMVEMGHPILFAKAIIILAFIPIFTFQRVEGKIFSPVALTLSFAMLGAVLLTMTLVPTLLALTMKRHTLEEKHNAWMHYLQERYRGFLNWAGARRPVFMLASVGALVLTLALAPRLGSEFLPKLDEGNIWLTISLPTSSSLDTTKAVERRVRNILRDYKEVANIITQVGRPDDGTDPKGPNNMEFLVDLIPHGEWRFPDKEALVQDMARKIRTIPGVPTNFSQVIEDNVQETLSGVKGDIAIKVFGPDLEVLTQKSEQIASILNGIRGASDVAAVKIGGQTELDIAIDRGKIARLGVNISDVNSAIQTALAGNAVNTFYDGDQRFDVTIRLSERFRNSIDNIAAIQINLPGGAGTVSLGDIARIQERQGATRISREAGGRNAAVKANLLGRDQGSFVAEAQRKVAQQVVLPPGYHITWGGQFENQQRAVKRLGVIVPITALLIFSLLFWAFRSIRKASLVLMIVPFSMIGGIAGLALAGLHFSVSAAVGFIAVAGISVQNGVIMLEQFVEMTRAETPVFASAVEGAVSRLRPILMTALMAGLGLLPAALSHAIGSETQRPFAVVIVGGILSATFFTLLLLPLAYPYFAERRPADR